MSENLNQIKFYNKGGKYYEFTNFAEGYPINFPSLPGYENLAGKWKTSEQLFQAAGFRDRKEIVEQFRETASAHEAFDLKRKLFEEGKKLTDGRNGWDGTGGGSWRGSGSNAKKIEVMKLVTEQKFRQHKSLKNLLLETSDKEIIEESPTDDCWGNARNGKNWLGRILIEVREKLQAEEKNDNPPKNPKSPSPEKTGLNNPELETSSSKDQSDPDNQEKKKPPSQPTNNLSQTRTRALSTIKSALNSEPPLTTSDLSSNYQDYENKLNQFNSEKEINDLKEEVLQDIQIKRKAKQEDAILDEKINSAQTEAEKVDLFKEVGKKLGEETPERTAKLEQIKNELAANSTQLRAAIQHEITAQMTAFEVKAEDLSSEIKTQLESLKNEQNSTKIREIEKTVSQAIGKTGVNLKINRLETEITAALQSKNQTKIKTLRNQLLQLINSPNSFYQNQKSQFQALLQKLNTGESQNQVPNKDGFPWKIVIPISLVVIAGMIGLVIVFRKRKSKSRSPR